LTPTSQSPLLNDRLGQAMAASKRSGRYGAVMFMDLDNFKAGSMMRMDMMWVICY